MDSRLKHGNDEATCPPHCFGRRGFGVLNPKRNKLVEINRVFMPPEPNKIIYSMIGVSKYYNTKAIIK